MNFEKIRSTIRDFTKQNKSNKFKQIQDLFEDFCNTFSLFVSEEPIEFIVEKINNY